MGTYRSIVPTTIGASAVVKTVKQVSSESGPVKPVHASADPVIVEEVEGVVEEEELLLVDDFDGQCSRTYPNNHSKILAWRKSKEEKSTKVASPAAVENAKTEENLKLAPEKKKSDSKAASNTALVTTSKSSISFICLLWLNSLSKVLLNGDNPQSR